MSPAHENRTSKRAVEVRELRGDDLSDVVRIDGLLTGERKTDYWKRVFHDFIDREHGPERVGLAAEQKGRLIGYLLGEVRAFEFGSDACGWIFAVGVDPRGARAGVASALLEQACEKLRASGVETVRTMVRRDDVDVLSFFRANGFAGGSFVQLERDLEETT